jgi:hypothetical protein
MEANGDWVGTCRTLPEVGGVFYNRAAKLPNHLPFLNILYSFFEGVPNGQTTAMTPDQSNPHVHGPTFVF